MQLFHEQHRNLLFLSILGGVYLPSMSRIIPWKPVNTFLKGYAVTAIASVLLVAIFAARQMIFLSDDILVQVLSANNVCDSFMAFGQALIFNVNRNQAQALYNLWDVYFTGDGHDDTRKKLVESLKKPNRKLLIVSVLMIQFTSCLWCVEQFWNEDYEFSVPIGVPYVRRSPDYFIWATFILFTYTLFVPMVLGVDLLIMEPMIWITAEFIRLRQSLAEILNTLEITENGEIIRRENDVEQIILNKQELKPDFEQVDKKIKKWIIEHQKLLIFHRKMVAVNHLPLAIQLVCTFTAMCFFSFLGATLFWGPFDTFVNLLYYIPNYALFYIMATYGDRVKEQAYHVFDSAFAANWSVYPKHIQSNLQIIAMRTNSELIINIMKLHPLDSPTFFLIAETAYSFYGFLVTIAKPNNNS